MIPKVYQALLLWQTYALPEIKQKHSLLVARVAKWIAEQIERKKRLSVNKELLYVAGLLHDIDKNIPWEAGETHPDAGVRILGSLGYDEVAILVKKHPLHAIVNPEIAPVTLEEKILYLADKMTKYEVLSVDERFSLWRAESLTSEEHSVLDAAYPKVKQLELEICDMIQMTPDEMRNACKNDILQQERETI